MNKKVMFAFTIILTVIPLLLLSGRTKEKNLEEAKKESSEQALKILDKVTEALGGKANLAQSINWNYIAKIKTEIPVSEDPPKYFECSEYFKAPEKVRRDSEYRMPARGIVVRYFEISDGKNAWSSFRTPGELTRYTEEENIKRIRSCSLDKWHLWNWLLKFYEDRYEKEFLGEDNINGKDVYKLKIDYKKDNSLMDILFIDKNSYLPIQRIRSWKSRNKVLTDETYYFDYSEINEIKIPFKAICRFFISKKLREEIIDILKDLAYGPGIVIEDEFFTPESVSQSILDEYKKERINHQIEPKIYENSKLESIKGYLLLHLKGTPQEMGAQHGYLMKDYINLLLKEYVEKGVYGGKKEVKKYFLNKAKTMEKYVPEEYIQEMKSLAEMAEIDYDDVLIINMIYESLMSIRKGPGCSAYAVDERGTKSRKIIFGRNFDFDHYNVLYKYPVIIFYSPSKGNKFISFGFPGFIGCPTGMNEKSLTLALLQSISKNSSFKGLPIPLLARYIIQYMNDCQEAIDFIKKSKRTFPINVFLVQKEPKRIAVVESDTKAVAVREAKNGYLICTNHFRILNLASDCPRYKRLEQLVEENYGKISEDESFLRDPKVMQPMLNIQSIIFVVDDLECNVSLNQIPAAVGPYEKFSFNNLQW